MIASVWGQRVEDFAQAAAALAGAPSCVLAVEVNVSCPNLEDRSRMFAHSASATREVVEACRGAGRPLWAKLSPNVGDIVEIAGAALAGGAEALVLVNTLLGIDIDLDSRRPLPGPRGGGLSGPATLPVSLRAVWDCARALPGTPIVGVGGIWRGQDAARMILAGASAVEVGTATFADPRAPARVLDELAAWLRLQGEGELSALRGAAQAL